MIENEANVNIKDAFKVPEHIELPDYIKDKNSEFGVYEGD